jgi:transcriptional regulator with XRE-family HTH domain
MGSSSDTACSQKQKTAARSTSSGKTNATAQEKQPSDTTDGCIPQLDVLRKQQGLTQQELAAIVGVTVTTISKWEQGTSGTETIRRFAELCRVLKCHIEDIVDVTKDERLTPRIAELRKQQGLSQRELAQAIGATEVTIANWERGRSGLDWIERLIRLCDGLDCEITDLLLYNEREIRKERPSISEVIRRRRSGSCSQP